MVTWLWTVTKRLTDHEVLGRTCRRHQVENTGGTVAFQYSVFCCPRFVHTGNTSEYLSTGIHPYTFFFLRTPLAHRALYLCNTLSLQHPIFATLYLCSTSPLHFIPFKPPLQPYPLPAAHWRWHDLGYKRGRPAHPARPKGTSTVTLSHSCYMSHVTELCPSAGELCAGATFLILSTLLELYYVTSLSFSSQSYLSQTFLLKLPKMWALIYLQ